MKGGLTKERFVPRAAAAQSGVERNPPVRSRAALASWTFNRAALTSRTGMIQSRGAQAAKRRRPRFECVDERGGSHALQAVCGAATVHHTILECSPAERRRVGRGRMSAHGKHRSWTFMRVGPAIVESARRDGARRGHTRNSGAPPGSRGGARRRHTSCRRLHPSAHPVRRPSPGRRRAG